MGCFRQAVMTLRCFLDSTRVEQLTSRLILDAIGRRGAYGADGR